MTYIDGFVIPVRQADKETYAAFARMCAPYFTKHGALAISESWGDDVPSGETTSFPMAVKLKDDEIAVFSWIVWPDKATREAGNKSAMADMEADGLTEKDVPFDGKRMIYGGFEQIVAA